jgi:DeoR family transcriptional regulator, suf operon transcriptional repressor
MPDITISPAGLRIIKLMVGTPPQSVAELTRAAGVTRTAVTEQLDELTAAGFVERTTQRLSSRGRPRHLYTPTRAALVLLFAGNQRLVVPAIWHAIHDLGGEELTHKILKRVSRSLADYYNTKITAKKPQERLRQLMGQLVAEGGMLEAVEDEEGRVVVCKRSCPFISMVDEERSVCYIDLEMMSEVVGKPVKQIACRHDGAPCCKFAVAGKEKT